MALAYLDMMYYEETALFAKVTIELEGYQ